MTENLAWNCCCGVSNRAFGHVPFGLGNGYCDFGAVNGDGPGVTPFSKPKRPLVLGHAFCIEPKGEGLAYRGVIMRVLRDEEDVLDADILFTTLGKSSGAYFLSQLGGTTDGCGRVPSRVAVFDLFISLSSI